MQIEKHAKLLKSIFKIKNSMVFYTDEAKNSETTGAATVRFFNVETSKKLNFRQIYRCNRCKIIRNRKSYRILCEESIFNQNILRYLDFY